MLRRSAHCVRRPRPGGIAALGDALTSGHSIPERWLLADDSWVAHAVTAGRLRYTYDASRPDASTSSLRAQWRECAGHRPAAAVMLTGVKDVYESSGYDAAVEVLHGLAGVLRAQAVVPIFATLPPVEARKAEVLRFNAAVRRLAESTGTLLIDFHAAFAGAAATPRLFEADGLHPSPEGAEAMGRAAVPTLRAALSGAASRRARATVRPRRS